MDQQPDISPAIAIDQRPLNHDAFCRDCHYSLRGLQSDRCPECGRYFDPNNPASMRFKVPGTLGRFLLTPPGWPLNGTIALFTLMTLCAQSQSDGYFDLLIPAILGWFAVSGIWVARLIAQWLAFRHYLEPMSKWRQTARRWLIGPGLLMLTILLVTSGAVSRLTFIVSRPAMDRIARQMIANPIAPPPKVTWIGLYPVTQIESTSGGMRFIVRGANFLGRSGFAHFPAGPPATTDNRDRYVRYSGNWYSWNERFAD